MKHFLVIILLTTVNVFVSGGAWGQSKTAPAKQNAANQPPAPAVTVQPSAAAAPATTAQPTDYAMASKNCTSLDSPLSSAAWSLCMCRSYQGGRDCSNQEVTNCQALQKDISTANDDAGQACSDAKGGMRVDSPDPDLGPATGKVNAIQACQAKAKACDKAVEDLTQNGEDLTGLMTDLSSASGFGALSAADQKTALCLPTRETGKDLSAKLDKAKEKTADVKEKITTEQERAAKAKNDLTKEMTTISDELKKAQNDATKKQLEDVLANKKQAAELALALTKAKSDILAKQLQKDQALQNQTNELAGLNAAMINLTCTADAQKIIDNIKRLTAGSSSGLSQGGGSTIQKAKAVYSQCVQAKLNAIDSINLKYKNMITTLDDDIATTQQGVASLQTQITDNQNYFTQIQTLNKQASSDQLTNAISKAQSIQTQLQDLNTNSMTKLNNLNSQLQSTQSSLNSVSNQITLYGGEGKLALATGKTYEDTVSAFEKIRNKKTTFIKANCCETLKINTGYCAEGNKSKYQSDQGVE